MDQERNDNPLCEYRLPLPTRKTFEGASSETKLNFLFDMSCVSLENQKKVFEHLEKHQKVQEREVNVQRTIAGLTGIVGGFVAALLAKIFKI